jgi:metal-responsive CopG/Arc/MetJ family transcriptional regulator
MVGLRIEPGLIARIDEWGSRNDVSRSEAIRRLLEKALGSEGD